MDLSLVGVSRLILSIFVSTQRNMFLCDIEHRVLSTIEHFRIECRSAMYSMNRNHIQWQMPWWELCFIIILIGFKVIACCTRTPLLPPLLWCTDTTQRKRKHTVTQCTSFVLFMVWTRFRFVFKLIEFDDRRRPETTNWKQNKKSPVTTKYDSFFLFFSPETLIAFEIVWLIFTFECRCVMCVDGSMSGYACAFGCSLELMRSRCETITNTHTYVRARFLIGCLCVVDGDLCYSFGAKHSSHERETDSHTSAW